MGLEQDVNMPQILLRGVRLDLQVKFYNFQDFGDKDLSGNL